MAKVPYFSSFFMMVRLYTFSRFAYLLAMRYVRGLIKATHEPLKRVQLLKQHLESYFFPLGGFPERSYHSGSNAHASLPRRRPPGRRSMWVRAIAVLAGSTAARLFVPPARPATVRAYVYSNSKLERIFS